MLSHIPSSGLESGMAGMPDFYKEDELKYHGKVNRGVRKINLLQVCGAQVPWQGQQGRQEAQPSQGMWGARTMARSTGAPGSSTFSRYVGRKNHGQVNRHQEAQPSPDM